MLPNLQEVLVNDNKSLDFKQIFGQLGLRVRKISAMLQEKDGYVNSGNISLIFVDEIHTRKIFWQHIEICEKKQGEICRNILDFFVSGLRNQRRVDKNDRTEEMWQQSLCIKLKKSLPTAVPTNFGMDRLYNESAWNQIRFYALFL